MVLPRHPASDIQHVTTPRSTAREAAAVEAQIRDAEAAIASLLKHLRPGCPPAQRVTIERMVAKKQTTLRKLRNKHIGLVRDSADEIPGQRSADS